MNGKKNISTLAIETSCDDTSLAIVTWDGKLFETKKICAFSQIKTHEKYGGVVPEIASRLHSEKILPIIEEIGHNEIAAVDFITVTAKPWLPGSLLIGKTSAFLLGEYFDKKVVEVDHIHGHIFSLWLERDPDEIKFPMVVLTASWWHNDIYLVTNEEDNVLDEANFSLSGFHILKLGWTVDDASGEAFDKVSRMLWGAYPGGPWISKMAKDPPWDWTQGLGSGKFFKRIRLDKDGLDFSFSWIKSQVNNLLRKIKRGWQELTEDMKSVIAYEFQESVVDVLVTKLLHAWKKYDSKTVAICGGVSANQRWWEELQITNDELQIADIVLKPVKILYSTDNAAMIGVVGVMKEMKN